MGTFKKRIIIKKGGKNGKKYRYDTTIDSTRLIIKNLLMMGRLKCNNYSNYMKTMVLHTKKYDRLKKLEELEKKRKRK